MGEQQQQQQQPQLYQYSVKIEMTAKGLAMPTIHVYSNDIQTARKQAVEQYCNVIEELKAKGVPVAVLDLKPWVSYLCVALQGTMHNRRNILLSILG